MILEFGETRAFEPFDRWGHEREVKGKSLGQLLDEFARVRAENLDMGWFEHMDDELAGLGIKPSEADAAVDVGDAIPTMRQALAQHHTQIPPDSFLLTWPPHIMREVFRTAYFRQLRPAPNGRQLSDLLEGLYTTPR